MIRLVAWSVITLEITMIIFDWLEQRMACVAASMRLSAKALRLSCNHTARIALSLPTCRWVHIESFLVFGLLCACRQCSGYSKEKQTHFGFQSVQEDVKKEKVALGVCKSFSRRYMSRCLVCFMPWQIHMTSWMMPCLLVYTECGRTTSLHRFTIISH